MSESVPVPPGPVRDEPLAQPEPPVRLVGLDGLRGVAILLVFAVHWTLALAPRQAGDAGWIAASEAAFAAGNLGVDLFFVLSGFLIYDHCLAKPLPAARFLARRAWRIYPAYAATFLLYLALALASPASGKLPPDPGEAALYLLRCFLLLPGILQEAPLVGVAWSLSYELLFYLALPPFVAGLGLRRRPARQRSACILALAAAILAFSLATGLHERLLMFPAGMLARELVRARPRLVAGPAFLWCAAGASLAALAAAAFLRRGWPYLNPDYPTALAIALLGAVGFAAAVAASLQPGGPVAWLAGRRPLRFLGEVSYSYYLLHNLTIRALVPLLPAAIPGYAWLALAPIGFAATLVPGLALYRLVERPCLAMRPRPAPPGRTPGTRAVPVA